jgi:hypothetical protein
LAPEQVRFLLYHSDHDSTHLATFERSLDSGISQLPGMADRIVTTSAVVARLNRLQLEELIRP